MHESGTGLTILQVAPIQYPISDRLGQGGTERVVYLLQKELIELGVKSIVACCSGSNVVGSEYVAFEQAISDADRTAVVTHDTHRQEYELYFERVARYALENSVSILHDHTGWFVVSEAYERRRGSFPFPIVTTVGGCYPLLDREAADIYSQRKKEGGLHFCALSHLHKNWLGDCLEVDSVVHNGIDVAQFPFEPMENKKGYLFSLGRIAWWKGQQIAIRVAKGSGRKLAFGGSIVDTDYFDRMRSYIHSVAAANKRCQKTGDPTEMIDRFVKGPAQAMYIGEVNDLEKVDWYKFASCFLMPIQWEEPFGLVMIEAMACGTPVVGFNRGSVPEIVSDGKTGFIVDTEQQMIEAVREVDSLDSQCCRSWVEDNFVSARMARNYLDVYKSAIEDCRSRSRQPRQGALMS